MYTNFTSVLDYQFSPCHLHILILPDVILAHDIITVDAVIVIICKPYSCTTTGPLSSAHMNSESIIVGAYPTQVC